MRGVVSKFQKNGLIEVQTDSFVSIIELIGGYNIEIGDEIEGNLDSLGGEEIYNLSQDENMDVFIQDLR